MNTVFRLINTKNIYIFLFLAAGFCLKKILFARFTDSGRLQPLGPLAGPDSYTYGQADSCL